MLSQTESPLMTLGYMWLVKPSLRFEHLANEHELQIILDLDIDLIQPRDALSNRTIGHDRVAWLSPLDRRCSAEYALRHEAMDLSTPGSEAIESRIEVHASRSA
jgi:hypothetical protein